MHYNQRYPRKQHHRYYKFSHALRLNCIYQHVVHGTRIVDLSDQTGLSYNTIRNFVVGYLESGRTNKKSYLRSSLASKALQKRKAKFLRYKSKAWKLKYLGDKANLVKGPAARSIDPWAHSPGFVENQNTSSTLAGAEVPLAAAQGASAPTGFPSSTPHLTARDNSAGPQEVPRQQLAPPTKERSSLPLISLMSLHSQPNNASKQESPAVGDLSEKENAPQCLDKGFKLISPVLHLCEQQDVEIIVSDNLNYQSEKAELDAVFGGPLQILNSILQEHGSAFQAWPDDSRASVARALKPVGE